MSIDADLRASIALTRFGLGARPGELAATAGDPIAYLKAQIRETGADQPEGAFESAAQRIRDFHDYTLERRQARAEGDPRADPVKQAQKLIHESAGAEFLARMRLACQTPDSFRERWTLFWANHFTVAAKNLATATVVGPFEREAIRPHVFGRFEDLLVASSRHPAMLIYLDQAQSVGPDSPLARRPGFGDAAKRPKGLNENLAREIMELHTLGVGSGYSQADVTEFARALTGWSVVGPNENRRAMAVAEEAQPGQFLFRAFAHEPGTRQVLGRAYGQEGMGQGLAILHDLAANPATARHVAFKLARHFVADDPPPALVARLEASFQASGGRLDHLARTLIDSPEAWAEPQAKFKTPYEFLVSGYRALGVAPFDVTHVAPILTSLGQPPFNPGSPKGWPEEAEAWAAPDAIVKRMSWSEAFGAATAAYVDQPSSIAQSALGARLSPPAATAIAHAESRPEAIAILMMSPEFQRR